MIDRCLCREFLLRLSALPGYRFLEDEGKKALLDAMQRAFRSTEQLEAAVDEMVRSNTTMPTPADFYEMAARGLRVAYIGCALCDWTGFQIVTRNGVEGAERCSCHGGK